MINFFPLWLRIRGTSPWVRVSWSLDRSRKWLLFHAGWFFQSAYNGYDSLLSWLQDLAFCLAVALSLRLVSLVGFVFGYRFLDYFYLSNLSTESAEGKYFELFRYPLPTSPHVIWSAAPVLLILLSNTSVARNPSRRSTVRLQYLKGSTLSILLLGPNSSYYWRTTTSSTR